MAVASEEVRLIIKAEVDKAVADLKKFTQQTQQSEKGISKFTKALDAIKGATVLYSLYNGFTKVVKAASDLEEATNKFNVAFGDQMQKGIRGLEELNEHYAMSRRQAMEYSATLMNMTTSMGVASGKAAEMSINLTKLAADYASFHNVGLDESLTAFRAALSGEFEPMKRFGQVLNEATLKQEAMNMGLYDGKGALDAQTKALTTYNLLMKNSKNEMGDMIRTGDGWANTSKKIAARLEDIAAAIGSAVLPSVQKLGNAFLWLTNQIDMEKLEKVLGVLWKMGEAVTRLWMGVATLGASEVFDIVMTASGGKKTGGAAKPSGQLTATPPPDFSGGGSGGAGAFGSRLAAQKKMQEEYLDYIGQSQDNAFAEERKRYDSALQYAMQHKLSLEEIELQHQENLAEIEAEAFEAQLQRWEDKISAITSMATQLTSGLQNIFNIQASNEKARMEDTFAKRKLIASTFIKDEEKRNQVLQMLDAQKEMAQRQLARREFERNKALQIATTTINMASSIMGAWNSAMMLPPPASFIIGGVMTALLAGIGAAQIALISQQRPPAMASGGIIPGSDIGTLVRAGEGGRSEAIIPFDNPEAMDRMGGAMGNTYHVHLENAVVTNTNLPNEFIEAIDRGLYRLKKGNQSLFAGA